MSEESKANWIKAILILKRKGFDADQIAQKLNIATATVRAVMEDNK